MAEGKTRARVHLRIENDWLAKYVNNDNAVVDCEDIDSVDSKRRGIPIGILIGRNGSDSTLNTANVKAALFGENKQQTDVYTLALGVIHPLAVKFLYANATTGRDIKIFY